MSPLETEGKTVMLVGIDGELAGLSRSPTRSRTTRLMP